MANGDTRPRFHVYAHLDRNLLAHGLNPHTYHAAAALQFLTSGANSEVSTTFPFRLDTGAFLSSIPQKWVENRQLRLRRFLGPLSEPLPFVTAAGRGEGRVASGVSFRFTEATGVVCNFDLMVTAGLDVRDYGLICLGDVLRHFAVETEGALALGPSGEPLALPSLTLHPRAGWQRIRYRCPGCRIETWGRPGLRLSCEDCNRSLV